MSWCGVCLWLLSGPATPIPIDSPWPQDQLDRSIRTILRTYAFGGQSHRVQTLSDATWIVCSGIDRPDFALTAAEPLLVGTKPEPLPRSTAARKPTPQNETASLQRAYRKLVSLGLFDEAAEVAGRLVQPTDEIRPLDGVLTAGLTIAEPVGKPGDVVAAVFVKPEVSDRFSKAGISCRFDGASLTDAARRIAEETGVSIDVRPDGAPMPQVYFSCNRLPAGQALNRIAEGCGWIVETAGDRIVLRPPTLIPLRDARLPVLR